MLLGTCSCAVVRCVLCAISGFAAPGGRCGWAPVRVPWLWPAACLSGVPRGPVWCAAPRPVRSLSVLRSAFPTPWCLSPPRGLGPPALLGGCAGHAEAGREPGSLCLPLAPAKAGTLGSLRVVPVRGPAMGLSLAGPSGAGLGLRSLRWLVCVHPVTDAPGFPYHPSFDGGLGRCTEAVSCIPTPPLAGRRTPRPGPVRVCVCSSCLVGSGGPASRARSGAPHLFLWPLCLSPLLGPLRAGVAPVLVLCLPLPPPFCFCFVVFFSFCLSVLFCLAPPLSLAFLGFRPRVPWALALCVVRFGGLALLGSPCALAFFVLPGRGPLSGGCPPPLPLLLLLPFLVSPLVRAPLVSGFLCFPAPGALGLGAGLCLLCPAFCALFFFFCLPPPGSSCALACFVSPGWPVVVPRWLLPPPPPLLCLATFVVPARCLGFFSPLLCASGVSGFLWFAARGALGLGAVFCLFFSASCCPALRALSLRVCLPLGCWLLPGGCRPPPPPLLCLAVFVAPARCLCFFFFLCAPPLSPAFSGFRPRVPWASALCVVCFFGLPLLGSPCALASFVLSAWGLAAPCWLPPPPCVSRFSSLPLGAVCRVLCCAVCPWVRCCAALLRVVPPGVVLSCAVLLCCAGLVPLLVAPCPLVLPVTLGPCALLCCLVRCSPALCAVCCVCFVVAWWCVLLFAALPCAVCVPGCCAVRSLSSLLGAVLCFAVLVRLRSAVRLVRAVAGAWCCGALLCVVLFPLMCCGVVLGLMARGCLLVACFGVGVPVWPRGLLPCGWRGLLWCPASLCRVLWCCAVAWCCAVVLCCRVVLLLGLVLPSCGLSCCAVLCCWLAVLFFARWWSLRAVVLFPSCCAFRVFSALCAAVPCCAGCGALLPCAVCCGAVLSCGAMLSCSAVFLRCCLCVLCPPVACRAAPCCAVLCCWLSVLFFARWWRLCAVVPFPSLPARTKNINYLTCRPRWWRCRCWHALVVAVSWT